MKDSALYIHIPFCDHKCIYCDFYSIITSDNVEAFLISLKKEIKYFSHLYSKDRTFSSIFFGGGTPSLMVPDYLKEILYHLKKYFNVDDNAEITMETNPGTVDKAKLKMFKETGINRISIGIQSFDEVELKFLTRIHNKQTAIQTVYDASDIGFENISVDLIFNLQNQTKAKWIKNLETAIQLPINHISTYSLILERGTILNKMVLDKKVKMQSAEGGDDYDADLYETSIDFLLSKGFYQYEVSNFTKPGFECSHNNAYWRYRDYLSFGTSAHSFVDGK
ncbi:MAG: radical SAM family heme chaperone HemW, partial [Ignavibacteria bacterium]|nr:radical SAM family heme chaperone HemW [Ignavibacteria bacterium]